MDDGGKEWKIHGTLIIGEIRGSATGMLSINLARGMLRWDRFAELIDETLEL